MNSVTCRLIALAAPTGHTPEQLIRRGWAQHIEIEDYNRPIISQNRKPTAHSKALERALKNRSRPPKVRRAKF